MDCHTQRLKLRRFLIPFKINILGYLNFNSKNIRLGDKSMKYDNFLLNISQAVILKTQKVQYHPHFSNSDAFY